MYIKSLSLLLLSTLILTSCADEEIQEKKHFTTFTVGTGAFIESDSTLVTVEGKTVSDLSFKVPGRIEAIYVEPGQAVKKGQLLATESNEEGIISEAGFNGILTNLYKMGLDMESMSRDSVSLRSALEKLYDERLSDMDNEAKKARIAIEIAEKDLALAESNLNYSMSIFSGTIKSDSSRVAQAEKNLSSAKNSLENSEKLFVTQRQTISKNALSSMSSAFIVARNARDFSDELLGMTDASRNKNDAYETYLGAKNSSTKKNAEAAFVILDREYKSMYDWYYSHIVGQENISEQTIKEGLEKSIIVLDALRESLHAIESMLESSITSTSFSEEYLSTLKNKNSTFMSQLESSLLSAEGSGIKGSLNAINTIASTESLQLGQLRDVVKMAEEGLALARAGKDTSSSDILKNIENLRTNVRMKKDALELSRIGEDQVKKNRAILINERDSKIHEMEVKIGEIASKMHEVGTKESEIIMNKNLAGNTIESGKIYAPFDGFILKKNYEPGTVISAGVPLFTISSNDGKRVRAYYDSQNFDLKVDDLLLLKTPAEDKEFSAKIFLTNLLPDKVHNKSYLEADLVDFPGKIGERLKLVFTQKIELSGSGVVIPLKAIVTRYGTPGVFILEEKRAKFTLIDSKKNNDSYTLVTNISPGKKVIVEGKDNIVDGEILEK